MPAPPAGDVVAPITVTIDEQIDHIERKLAESRRIVFRSLLSGAASRLEVIVTLLAVLELIKQDRVAVRQEALFDEIIIERPLALASHDASPPTNRAE